MYRFVIYCVFVLSLLILSVQESLGISIIIRPPEKVLMHAPLIIECRIEKVDFHVIPNSSLGYADLTLSVLDVLKGTCSSKIMMRRYGVRGENEYLSKDITPTFFYGDQIIIALRKHKKGYYKHLGLYNGSFYIINGLIQQTNISKEMFKSWIAELLNGTIQQLPPELPRFKVESLKPDTQMSNKKEIGSLNKTLSTGSHLNGQFIAQNHTWNASYLPVKFYYNDDNAPDHHSVIIPRINDAFGVWNNLSYCNLTFSTMTGSDLTDDEQVNNSTSVILWTDWTSDVLAEEFTYPNFTGTNTITGSDIILNTDYGDSWYFSSSPPSTRNDSEYDFVDILVHELGHTHGLGHTTLNSTIMGPSYLGCTVSLRTLADGDKAGAVHQHPKTNFSGTLPHSIVLSATGSSFNITDNLTIPSGMTFKLESGKTVNITANKKITVNGTLIANGSSGNEITFDATSGTWLGIEVGSSGHFNPSFCVFDDVQLAITYYDSYGDVHSCEFTNYDTALYYDHNAYGRVDYCTMEEYGGIGIKYTDNSTGDIRSYNSIQDNLKGVDIDSTSNPDLGTYAGQGYNYISNVQYDIYSLNASTIYAEYNYWGGSPEPNINEGANVDWEPDLESDPLSKARAPHPEILMPEFNFNPEDTIGVSEFNEAHLTYLEGNTDDALALFSILVDKYPDYNMGRQSLAFENRILRNEDRKAELGSRLLTVSTLYEGKEISGMANSIRVGRLIREGDYKGAISTAADIVSKFPKTDLEKYSLYDLGNIHWYYLNDQKTGESYYRQLIADYPKDHLAISALATLGEWVPSEREKRREEISKINLIPPEFSLDQNYPNPFNPTTTLTYELPEDVHVVVSIYNIKGQLVARLVDKQQKAGHHWIKWNASNQPSGMYVYRMEVGDFASTRKLMLLK